MAALPRSTSQRSLSSRRTLMRSAASAASAAAFAAALGVLAPDAGAQILFSFDHRGPSNAAPVPCAPGVIGAGDVVSVRPGVICGVDGPVYGPLPPPDMIVMGGPGGLGVPSIGGCVGAPPGAFCPRELDALSTGMDPFPVPGQLPAGFYLFSVDECSAGIGGTPLAPNVFSEAPVGDSANDVFEALVIPPYPMPFPVPVAAIPGNSGLIDGNGMVSPTTAHYPGLGLVEPSMPTVGAPARGGDNLDALDTNVGPVPVGGGIFFSLDGTLFNPCNGFPGLGTAQANGLLPGMVLMSAGGGFPAVYAPPPLLGLDLAGPGTDDLDALAIFENGVAGYQVSPGAYAWGPGAPDMLLFSVRRGSAIVGAIASGPIAAPIEPGDVLIPPAGAGLPPQIFIPAEYLGLMTVRSGTANMGDELDALDTHRPPATALTYCHGDGTNIACPCGNTGANGNGCANSTFAAGANLAATGNAQVSADSVLLTATNMTGGIAVFFQGATQLPPFVVDDGIGCVGGPVIRLGANPVVGGTSTYPMGAQPTVSVRGALPAMGGTRFYQTFYRNAVAAFCPPATSNRTNGLAIVWAP
jgi:hypothetical protein